MYFKRVIPPIIAIMLLTAIFTACANLPWSAPAPAYDPAKDYAAFLVLESANGRAILDNLKERSLNEKYEIGPIEYYKLGTKDFEPIIKKLTASPQIKLLWLASSLMDIPDIQKAITKVGYKGALRYMPATQSPAQ